MERQCCSQPPGSRSRLLPLLPCPQHSPCLRSPVVSTQPCHWGLPGVRRQKLCWGKGAGSSTVLRWAQDHWDVSASRTGENGRRLLGDLFPRLKTVDSTSKRTLSNEWQQKASVIFTLDQDWCCLVLPGCSAVGRTPLLAEFQTGKSTQRSWVWLVTKGKDVCLSIPFPEKKRLW